MSDLTTVRAILDLARWAPSGDNTQPWRFEIRSGQHLIVHGFDTRSHCVYDLDGHSSQLALGGLLESIRIAASANGLAVTVARRPDAPDTRPTFDVHLSPDPAIRPSALIPCLQARCVQRRALQTRPLTSDEKMQLEASVGSGYRVHWREGFKNRWRAARLMWRNAHLRLTLPEAFEVHRSIIQWNARFSEDRIPDQALGANPLTTRLMRFAMQSWPRVAFMNRWLGGTIAPRIELDLIPSLACAGHFLLAAGSPCRTIDDYIAAGGAMQRFWLTATSLGLQVQPEMTPLIFARYTAQGRRFSAVAQAPTQATAIAAELGELFGAAAVSCGAFMGRIGAGSTAQPRSLRLPLEKLLLRPL
jgi:nitroreductase